jgi:hypothetical protein
MRKMALLVGFGLMALSGAASAQQLYGRDGTYLGNLSSNPYDANSTSNPYGQYGSPYSPNSINNPYGVYGSPYSNMSPNNPYATQPPVIYGTTP